MDKKPLLIIVAVIIIYILEGFYPHYRGRRNRLKHAFPHALTAVLNGVLTKLALAGVTASTIAWAEQNSVGLTRMISLPGPAGAALVFLLFDVWMYAWHRANHRIGFLWLFHRAHHADVNMDTTTALRFHPGELVLSTFFRLPVVIALGMSFGQLVLFETMLNLATLFHHSNLALPERGDRVLRTVVVTPNMHRVHHSIEGPELNSNFTSLLSCWDRLFRTFRMREDTRAITLGLTAFREQYWQGLPGFLATPFRR